ncbi:MAG: T9SS type A sorting domain-containing protein [Bacteroidetes bacterium]|nr:T9SS type A sorting domain-containing protein [Bacteroidota bacterium]
MKLKIVIILTMLCGIANAQPVIPNGNNYPLLGTTGNYYIGNDSLGDGTAGANQVWNFNGGNSMKKAGTYTFANPSSTPYASTFPTATGCRYIDSTGGFTGSGIYAGYNYDSINATKCGVLGREYFGVQDSCKTSSNGFIVLKFPFNYTDSVFDIANQSCYGNDSVSVVYDGYGTLTTPLGNTYSNVIRVKGYHRGGSILYYFWTTNPLMVVFFTFPQYNLSGEYGSWLTNINEHVATNLNVGISPNPFSTQTTLQTDNLLHNATLTIYNSFGQQVKSLVISHQSSVVIERGNLASGLYFVRLTTPSPVLGEGGGEVYTGKLVITDK